MTIGDTVVNDNWVLKGCGGWWSEPVALEANKSYPIDAWFYEYGGGACNQLLYINSTTWSVVPADWFSQNQKAQTVLTRDPALLALLTSAKAEQEDARMAYEGAQGDLSLANSELISLQQQQSQIPGTIEVASQDVTNKQEELIVRQQELQAIPPFSEPTPTPEETEKPVEKPTEVIVQPIPEPEPTETPKPEPEPELPVNVKTVDPQSLTPTQAEELKAVANEILETAEQGSPEYEEALTALFVVAQADDIVLDESLESVPGLAATVAAINFLGNAGADMSPKVREESKKIVVTAVVAVGAAVNAATGAALTAAAPSAAASASAGGSGGTSSTRRKD